MPSLTASLMVNVFDGTRQPVSSAVDLLVRLIDGDRNTVSDRTLKGPNIHFTRLPFHDNLQDNYTVLVWAKDHVQAGLTPVRVSPQVAQSVDLMLLPKDAGFNFHAATWSALEQTHPRLVELLSARDRYEQLMEEQPAALACLLNIVTALGQIFLPAGTPLDYLKQLLWETPPSRDRFYAWADKTLLGQVKLAAQQGAFREAPSALHPGATASYKQVQFGEADVQLSFHEASVRIIDGADCLMVEPDIDYYQDQAAHFLLEVIPNTFFGCITDPKTVYALRWMAGRHAGVPEFNPPYTIE